MKKLNIISALKFSVMLIDKKAVDSEEAEVVASGVTKGQFDALAEKKGFTQRKGDNTLLGYYYVNKIGDTLQTCAASFKKGDKVPLFEGLGSYSWDIYHPKY